VSNKYSDLPIPGLIFTSSPHFASAKRQESRSAFFINEIPFRFFRFVICIAYNFKRKPTGENFIFIKNQIAKSDGKR
jgi:hypothetical protein